MRADAARNRDRLLRAARDAFAAGGTDVSLDEIAAAAQVGPGTLHRHFPSKSALIATVLEQDLGVQLANARALLTPEDRGEALFSALEMLLDQGLENQAMKSALAAEEVDFRIEAPDGRRELMDVIALLLAAAQRSGTVDEKVDVSDVLAVLAGALAAQSRATPERRHQVRELVLAGLRRG
jgi:AcrR family transcriptional regulator